MALWSSNHSNPHLWVDWRRRSLSCPRFNEYQVLPCLDLQLSSHDSSVGSNIWEHVSKFPFFRLLWVSRIWSCDMWPETVSTAFLCKARWSAPWLEEAASVCSWKGAQAVIERVPKTHRTIKSASSSVLWAKLRLDEFTANESVLTGEDWSVSRFVPGELSVCWHNHGSVSEIRHLILESRIRAGVFHVRDRIFCYWLPLSETKQTTGWNRGSFIISADPPLFPGVDHHRMFCPTMPLVYILPGIAVFLVVSGHESVSLHMCFAVFICIPLKFRESMSTLQGKGCVELDLQKKNRNKNFNQK